MLWEHELTGECYDSFFEFFQTSTSFYNLIGTWRIIIIRNLV